MLELRSGAPVLMGVVNASPESFYDGVRSGDLSAQLARAHELAREGAQIIDVGGQSGVTHRAAVSVEEEVRRVAPLVERLAADGVTVSIDTWRAPVARAALAAGAAMVNDASGLRDLEVADACAEAQAALVVCHTRAVPKVKSFPPYQDVAEDVTGFLTERLELASEHGVGEEQLVVDPGPDLSKTPAQTVDSLRGLATLRALGRPILLAVSRKDFVGAITARPPAERLAGTLAAVGEGVDAGASIVRTHDVREVADFLAVRGALRGERELPRDLQLDERLRRTEDAA